MRRLRKTGLHSGVASIALISVLGLFTVAALSGMVLSGQSKLLASMEAENFAAAKRVAKSCIDLELLLYLQTQDVPDGIANRQWPFGSCQVCWQQGDFGWMVVSLAWVQTSRAIWLVKVLDWETLPKLGLVKLLPNLQGTCLEAKS